MQVKLTPGMQAFTHIITTIRPCPISGIDNNQDEQHRLIQIREN